MFRPPPLPLLGVCGLFLFSTYSPATVRIYTSTRLVMIDGLALVRQNFPTSDQSRTVKQLGSAPHWHRNIIKDLDGHVLSHSLSTVGVSLCRGCAGNFSIAAACW